MVHLQRLTATLLRTPSQAFKREPKPTTPQLPDRDTIRKMAEVHHRQLVNVKRSGRSSSDALRAQTETLRRITQQLTAHQAETFLNAYTEESSAVERDWVSRQSSQRKEEPLVLIVINTLIVLAAVLAIGAAIYYVM